MALNPLYSRVLDSFHIILSSYLYFNYTILVKNIFLKKRKRRKIWVYTINCPHEFYKVCLLFKRKILKLCDTHSNDICQ